MFALHWRSSNPINVLSNTAVLVSHDEGLIPRGLASRAKLVLRRGESIAQANLERPSDPRLGALSLP